MSFRKRMGIDVRDSMQIDSLDKKTKNLLYSYAIQFVNTNRSVDWNTEELLSSKLSYNIAILLKEKLNKGKCYYVKAIGDIFDSDDYSYIYEVLEFIFADILHSNNCHNYLIGINQILEQEKCNYKLGNNGEFRKVCSEEELKLLNTVSNIRIKPVEKHIQKAISEYSSRDGNNDYQAVCHESLKAVEALLRSYLVDSGKGKTLGDCKTPIQKKFNIPKFVISGVYKIWEESNQDTTGIRHAGGSDDSIIGEPEAYYVLITCSSFINYMYKKYKIVK